MQNNNKKNYDIINVKKLKKIVQIRKNSIKMKRAHRSAYFHMFTNIYYN